MLFSNTRGHSFRAQFERFATSVLRRRRGRSGNLRGEPKMRDSRLLSGRRASEDRQIAWAHAGSDHKYAYHASDPAEEAAKDFRSLSRGPVR
jgi:hypothetical protein